MLWHPILYLGKKYRNNTMKIIILISFFFLVSNISIKAQKTVFLDSVINYMCEKNIMHSDVVIKQAILETGWFKAPFLMSRNNLFGFRKINYLKFETWKACVDYYKVWQDKHYTNSKEDYYHFLVRIKYATDQYPYHLKKINCNRRCDWRVHIFETINYIKWYFQAFSSCFYFYRLI